MVQVTVTMEIWQEALFRKFSKDSVNISTKYITLLDWGLLLYKPSRRRQIIWSTPVTYIPTNLRSHVYCILRWQQYLSPNHGVHFLSKKFKLTRNISLNMTHNFQDNLLLIIYNKYMSENVNSHVFKRSLNLGLTTNITTIKIYYI